MDTNLHTHVYTYTSEISPYQKRFRVEILSSLDSFKFRKHDDFRNDNYKTI